MQKLKKNHIYRSFFVGNRDKQKTGHYMEFICTEKEERIGLILYITPGLNLVPALKQAYKVGNHIFLEEDLTFHLLHTDIKDYTSSEIIVYKDKIVEKEVIIKKEVIKNINKFEETLIDKAYNFYCKIKGRFFDEFV